MFFSLSLSLSLTRLLADELRVFILLIFSSRSPFSFTAMEKCEFIAYRQQFVGLVRRADDNSDAKDIQRRTYRSREVDSGHSY
jgi:hypothetical protein